ncbi:MAG: hypothetical protein LAO20_11255 [Acidobacteriia bacterium]|nr:hypothetical protein [Terriglobia bacterium]
MTPRISKGGKGSGKSRKLEPRRRGPSDIAPTIPKSYTLPFPVILEIRRVAKEYGSQGRALQVASEILVRMKKRPPVAPPDPDLLMRMTYKLTPRTARLIDQLARTQYEDAGQAISACMKTLKLKKID